MRCPGFPFQSDESRWREAYGILHSGEGKNGNFVAKDWEKTGGDPYVRKMYRTPSIVGVEITDIVLQHTPQ